MQLEAKATAFASTVIACLVVSGCGGKSGGGGVTGPTASPSSVSLPSTTPPSSPLSSAPSAAAAAVDEATLQAALLTAAEVGAPFHADTKGNTGSDPITGCTQLAALLNDETTSVDVQHAAAEFTGGDNTPNPVGLGEELTDEPPALLTAGYAQALAAMTNCHQLNLPLGGGKSVPLKLTPISFAPGATGARLDGELSGVTLNGYIAIGRLSPSAVLAFIYFQGGSGSSQLASALFTHAQQKALRLLGHG